MIHQQIVNLLSERVSNPPTTLVLTEGQLTELEDETFDIRNSQFAPMRFKGMDVVIGDKFEIV